MKRGTTFTTALALALIVLFSACSVEKRHYRPGFHVGGNAKAPKTEVKKAEPADLKQQAVVIDKQAPAVVPSTYSASNDAPTTVVATPAQTKAAERVVTTTPATKAETKLPGSKHVVVNNVIKKAMKGASPEASMENKIVAFILCLLLGWLGIHRFYLGFPLSGILYIALFLASALLFGFLGVIGWIAGVVLITLIIIDLVFIIFDMPLLLPQ